MIGVDRINPWLAPFRPNSVAKLRLFCFPYAGGAAHIYRTWSRYFPPEIEVCPLQLPGRSSRLQEMPFTSMELLVKACVRELRSYLDKPFAFFGHSMGAIIGFEIARLLRRLDGRLPVHLFVSGHGAPQLARAKTPTYSLPEPEFINEVSRLNGTPREVLEQPELMQVVLPLLRGDFELIETYVYHDEPPLPVGLTALGGLEDEEISRADLEGWLAQTTGRFSLRMLPGDHFYLNSSPQLLLPLLAQELRSTLP